MRRSVRRGAHRWAVGSVAAAVTLACATTGLALAEGASVPPAPAPDVLPPVVISAQQAAAPTPTGVGTAIGPLVNSTSLGQESVVVLDPASSQVLFERNSDLARIPASTLKLATAATALNVLGPQTRIPTSTAIKARTIYLVGGGDPTLEREAAGNPLAGGSASLKALARATIATLNAGRKYTLVYDDSAFTGPVLGPGWPSSFPGAGVVAPVTALVVDGGRVRPGALSRVADPSRQAAEVFADYLRDQGLTVTKVRSGIRDSAAAELAAVESPPVSDIVQRMLTDSENNYAEALAHLAGGKLLDDPSFRGGAAATKQTLAQMGIATTAVTVVDGSGLSRQDKVPARVLADVLSDMARGTDPDLAAIAPGLAIAGLTGTLADRFTSPQTLPGRGYVHGKTGTLTGVSSLAGTVQDADGRVLVFALIANKVTSLDAARETMDRIASRLATCGCR